MFTNYSSYRLHLELGIVCGRLRYTLCVQCKAPKTDVPVCWGGSLLHDRDITGDAVNETTVWTRFSGRTDPLTHGRTDPITEYLLHRTFFGGDGMKGKPHSDAKNRTRRTAVCVEWWCALYADWRSASRSLSLRYLRSCLLTNRSSSFEMTDKLEIGRYDLTSAASSITT